MTVVDGPVTEFTGRSTVPEELAARCDTDLPLRKRLLNSAESRSAGVMD